MSAPTPSPHIESPSALPAGARLGEFELLSVLGIGGFGIVYLAFDHALEREVAVKEYMPASLAGRTETMHVSLRSQSDAETFALGLRSFVNEARLLARFDHPSLLKVHRFWEANGTAYMAMPVLRGRTLKDVRRELSEPPNEAWLRSLLEPLLGAIERLHSEGVYHRDIAPDNIQIEPDGRPVLLDFGAARRVISDKSQALTAILKPAYAPIEQYGEAGSVRQGPWTDFYALGATLHYLLMGRPPAPATARAVHDEPSVLTPERLPGCSAGFLHIVDWMLAPRPADRPQSVAQLREALAANRVPGRALTGSAAAAAHLDETVVLPSSTLDITIEGIEPDPRPCGPHTAQAAAARTPAPQPTLRPLVGAAGAAPAAGASSAAAAAAPLRATRPARSNWVPAVAALAVVGVLLAAGVALWPRAGPQSGPDQVGTQPAAQGAPTSASTEPVPAAAPGPALAKAEAPVASAAAESAPISMPSVAADPPAMPAAAQPTPAAKPAPPPAESAVTTVVAQPPKPVAQAPGRSAATTPKTSAAAKPAAPDLNPRPTEPPKADRTPAATPRQEPPPRAEAQPAAPPPEAADPAADPAKLAARGPEERCAGRNPIMYFVCMERACLRSEFAEHADCRRWHKEARRE